MANCKDRAKGVMAIAEKPIDSGKFSRARSWSLREVCHAIVAVGAWVLFFYWWDEVLGFTRSRDVVAVLVFIGIAVSVTTLINLVWVGHNVRIFRRKGPRTRVPEVSQERDSDALGRPIRLPAPGSLRRCPLVTISADEKEKIMKASETA